MDYNLKPDQHRWLMRELFVPHTVGVLPTMVFPLCNNNQCTAILAVMPRCDAQGVVGVEGDNPSPGDGSPRGGDSSWGSREDDDDDDNNDEEEELLVQCQARGPPNARAEPEEVEQEEPRQETPAPLAKPAPTSGLKRKLWDRRSDDDE